MSVEFDEPQSTTQYNSSMSKASSFLSHTVIKMGLAKTDKDAQWVLLGIAVLAVIVTFVFLPSVTSKTPVSTGSQMMQQ